MTEDRQKPNAHQLFISWAKFQRRNESMQPYFGYELHYVPSLSESVWAKPFGYFIQALRTLRIIRRSQPGVIWYQLPPTFLPHLMLAMRPLLIKRKTRIIADCHNRTFRPPWSRLPGLIPMLNRCDAVVVHNEEIAITALNMGVSEERLIVLETRPAQIKRSDPAPADHHTAKGDADTVLVPCSFNADEPIDALLAAAVMAPELTFLVSGNIAKARAKRAIEEAPENVVFTGFLPKADYEHLLHEASVVLGLTEIEGIQLSVANEAVGAGKALILSDTVILRDLFGSAALFTDNSPRSIAAACRAAVLNRASLDARSFALGRQREERWTHQAARLAVRLK